MTKPLIYIIAIFALWLYFKYSGQTTSGTSDSGGTSSGGTTGDAKPKTGGGGSSGGGGATRSFGTYRSTSGETFTGGGGTF